MPFVTTDIPGLVVFEPKVFEDSRGFFFEAYNEGVFKEQGIDHRWVQDNQSASVYGVIRGLHYQLPPYAQTKLVRVVKGKVLDVAVDMRQGSPTFGRSFSIVLSARNKKQLYIPKGFAHGFSVLSKKAELLYKCDGLYNKDSEAGIMYNDESLNIDWKIPEKDRIISEKDTLLPDFAHCRNTFVYS